MTALAGQAALVTGGSRGIGAAIARRLAHDGARVAITYVRSADHARKVVKLIEAAGGQALAIQADSADQDAVTEAVNLAAREFGRLDVLVNNAGLASIGPLQELALADIDQMVSVHVTAPLVAARAAARHLPDGGRVINIGSCLSERVPFGNAALYTMTKAALDGLARGLARELGPRGITVTTVHPGPIDTDMNPVDGPGAPIQTATTALGRFGTVDDIADAVAYLAGPSGRYVTGTTIAVDGGFAA